MFFSTLDHFISIIPFFGPDFESSGARVDGGDI